MYNNQIEEQLGAGDFDHGLRVTASLSAAPINDIIVEEFVADGHHEENAIGGFLPE